MGRTRNRLWITSGIFLAALLVLGGCGGAGTSDDSATDDPSDSASIDNAVFGTSSQGSEYHSLSVAMGDVISQETDIAVSVQSVGGSEATVRAIHDDNAELGMTNALATTNALNGEPPFDQPLDDVRLMMQGHDTLRQLIVRGDSGIETPADLEGMTVVGERPALVEIQELTEALLEVYEVDPSSVDIVSTAETNEALDALQQGTVDAVVAPGSAGSSFFAELAQNIDVRWIDLSDRMDEILDELGPAYVESTLPAGTYSGQEQEVGVVGIPSTIATRADMPDEAVYRMTQVMLENNDTIAAAQPQGEDWTTEDSMSVTQTVPFHQGAVEYYEEVGAWTEEAQQAQEELD